MRVICAQWAATAKLILVGQNFQIYLHITRPTFAHAGIIVIQPRKQNDRVRPARSI